MTHEDRAWTLLFVVLALVNFGFLIAKPWNNYLLVFINAVGFVAGVGLAVAIVRSSR